MGLEVVSGKLPPFFSLHGLCISSDTNNLYFVESII